MQVYILISDDVIGMPIEGVFFSEEEALEAAYNTCILRRIKDEEYETEHFSIRVDFSDISFEIGEPDSESSSILETPVLHIPIYAQWREYHHHPDLNSSLEYGGEVNLSIISWSI